MENPKKLDTLIEELQQLVKTQGEIIQQLVKAQSEFFQREKEERIKIEKEVQLLRYG